MRTKLLVKLKETVALPRRVREFVIKSTGWQRWIDRSGEFRIRLTRFQILAICVGQSRIVKGWCFLKFVSESVSIFNPLIDYHSSKQRMVLFLSSVSETFSQKRNLAHRLTVSCHENARRVHLPPFPSPSPSEIRRSPRELWKIDVSIC